MLPTALVRSVYSGLRRSEAVGKAAASQPPALATSSGSTFISLLLALVPHRPKAEQRSPPPHSLNDLFAVENGVFVLNGVSLRAGGETDNRFEGHEKRESAFFEMLELGEAEDSLQRERRGSSRISKSCL